MARVKRGVGVEEAPQEGPRAGQGLLRQQEPVVPCRQRAGHAQSGSTRSATAGPARASSAGCGSSGSTPACRLNDMSYSRFIAGLNAAGIEVDRKILADLAVTDAAAFGTLVERQGRKAADSERSDQRLSAGARWPSPTPRSNDCGASWGAAVRVRGRSRSSSRAPGCRRGGGRRWDVEACTSPRGYDAGSRRGRGPRTGAGVMRAGRRRRRRPSRCSPSCAMPRRPRDVLGRRDVRRRRRPAQPTRATWARSSARPRPPASTPWCSRRAGGPVQPEGRARVGRRAVPRAGGDGVDRRCGRRRPALLSARAATPRRGAPSCRARAPISPDGSPSCWATRRPGCPTTGTIPPARSGAG